MRKPEPLACPVTVMCALPGARDRCCWARGVTKHYTTAIDWYQKAAASGEVTAETNLASMYEGGEGVPQDYAKSMEMFQKVRHRLGAATEAAHHGHNCLCYLTLRYECKLPQTGSFEYQAQLL
jgi:Sel1 repeat